MSNETVPSLPATAQIRNSGSTLQPCMYKSGPRCLAQAELMLMVPETFTAVLGRSEEGYFMPMLTEVTCPEEQLPPAFDKLQILWNIRWRGRAAEREVVHPALTRTQYQAYVEGINVTDEVLRTELCRWYQHTREMLGTAVAFVHGDATLENVMIHGTDTVWIDPSTRPVPHEAELDVAKILQSHFGYERGGRNAALPVTERFLRSLDVDRRLVGYYLLTHLVRLWPLQPWARAWAHDVAVNLEERLCRLSF